MAKQHDKQFKLDAIQYYQDHKDLGVRGCAENLGIGYSTLTKWLKDFRESGDIPVRGSGNYASDEQKEIARLRRELRDAQDALDVLKKAINILGYEEITQNMADTGDFFALKIQGHSMEPRLEEGDIVIVRKQSYADSGDIAIILVNGNEATCKQIKKSDTGITLIGFNPVVYPPHFYSKEEIASLPVSIIGIVVESRHTWLKI